MHILAIIVLIAVIIGFGAHLGDGYETRGYGFVNLVGGLAAVLLALVIVA